MDFVLCSSTTRPSGHCNLQMKSYSKLRVDTCAIQRDSVYEIRLPTAGVGDKDF